MDNERSASGTEGKGELLHMWLSHAYTKHDATEQLLAGVARFWR